MDSSANPRDHATPVPPGDPDVSSFALPRNEPAAATERAQPVWLRRIVLIVFVMFCLQMGMMLLFLPWTPAWSNNPWLAEHWGLRGVLTNYFVRGLVSGLGLIDVFIGISEAVNYREPKRNA